MSDKVPTNCCYCCGMIWNSTSFRAQLNNIFLLDICIFISPNLAPLSNMKMWRSSTVTYVSSPSWAALWSRSRWSNSSPIFGKSSMDSPTPLGMYRRWDPWKWGFRYLCTGFRTSGSIGICWIIIIRLIFEMMIPLDRNNVVTGTSFHSIVLISHLIIARL